MQLNIPNLLTLFRIFLIPVLILFYLLPLPFGNLIVTVIFVIAGVTDLLDGYLARRLNQRSRFGAFLDPVADKLIVTTALVLLATDESLVEQVWNWDIFTIAIIIIIGRELAVSALREWMAEVGNRSSVAVNYIGKVKTIGQIIAVSFLLYREPLFGINISVVGEVLFYIAAILTIWSMAIYLRSAWPSLVKSSGD